METKSITVGQELRRFRARRGISQFDLAVCMEWKGTNPIIQIEKDRRVPRPDTIERLGKCLGLTYLEVHYLNGLAGYHLPTQLPPSEYVMSTLNHIAEALKAFPYPAYVLDYQFCFWLTNPASALLTLGNVELLRNLMAKRLNVFDLLFDSRLGLRAYTAQVEQEEQEQIFRFKASNSFRQHEPFFLAYPQCMDFLDPADYQRFAQAWQTVDMNRVTAIQPLQVEQFYSRLNQGDLILTLPTGEVAFYLRVDSILHLGDLLQIVTFVPVDEQHAAAVCRPYIPETSPTLKAWELMDIAGFYA